MIRNIVFDMGNVLIHWRPDLFLERAGIPEEDRTLLMRELFGSVEWIQMDRGVLPFEDGISAVCRRLPERLWGGVRELTLNWRRDHLLPVEGMAELIRELTLNWWRDHLLPVEGMAELIRELKQNGYGIYLLSNAKTDLPEYFGNIPGSECFDGRIVSADWKLLKPQPELYQVLLREYGLKAEECFFTDDLNINIEAAVLVGMSGAIFRGAEDLRRALTEAGVSVRLQSAQ